MKYTVKINGKTYELPARTEEMDRIVHRMTNIERLVNCGGTGATRGPSGTV